MNAKVEDMSSDSGLKTKILVALVVVVAIWGAVISLVLQTALRTILVEGGLPDHIVHIISNRFTLYSTSLTLVGIAFFSLIALYFAQTISEPLRKLIRGVNSVIEGERDFQVEVFSSDEIGQLARAFNQMVADLNRTTVSRDYFDSIIASISESVVVIDANRRIETVNPATLQLLGYGEGDLPGRTVDALFAGEPLCGQGLEALLENGYIRNLEKSFAAVDGRAIPVLISASVLCTEGGRNGRAVFVAKDITERKAVEEDLRRAKTELEERVLERTEELELANSMLKEEVSERRRAELALAREAEINSAIAHLTRTVLTSDSLEEISSQVLVYGQRLTTSELGFVGYVDRENGHLISSAVSRGGLKEGNGKERFVFAEFNGLWGWVLSNRKPILTNDASTDPRAAGTPPGHVPVERFLAAPALAGDSLVGLVALANAGRDYVEADREVVERLASLYAFAIERYRSGLALREALWETRSSRDRINAIVHSVAGGLMVTDAELRVQLMNGMAERMLAVSFSEAVGSPLPEVFGRHELVCKLRAFIDKGIMEGRFDVNLFAEAGAAARIIQARIATVRDRQEASASIIVMLDDVTREREIDRMKSEFISTAAHELRTPLTSIQGFSEMLLEPGALDEIEKGRFLRYIHEQALALSGIVEDLLDISRIESGRALVLRRETCRVGKCLEKIAPMIQGNKNRRSFEVKFQEPETEIDVDAEKIRQVMDNLISNAVKYSPDGGVIRICGRPEREHYRVSIEDRGVGMTPEQVEKIFDKFYRADGSSTAVGGIGLGMSIVKHIVEAHGGAIHVDSEFGRGTKVTFSLPLTSA